jgi:adenine-specific DNA-methyltransferase
MKLIFLEHQVVYQYSIEGMLNYYQLSIEMILRLTKTKGQIGIICPSSLFADLTSAKLRKHFEFA